MTDWTHHALLVVDVQNEFLNDVPDLRAYQRSLEWLLSYCRGGGMGVYHLRVCREPDRSYRMSFEILRGRAPCLRGTAGAETPEWAAALPDEPVTQKDTCDGFFRTDLDERLRSSGIRHLFVAGLVTSICVLTTAMAATDCRQGPEVEPILHTSPGGGEEVLEEPGHGQEGGTGVEAKAAYGFCARLAARAGPTLADIDPATRSSKPHGRRESSEPRTDNRGAAACIIVSSHVSIVSIIGCCILVSILGQAQDAAGGGSNPIDGVDLTSRARGLHYLFTERKRTGPDGYLRPAATDNMAGRPLRAPVHTTR